MGPHPVLSGNINEILLRAGEVGVTVPTLVRRQDDVVSLGRTISELYVAGCLDGSRTPGADERLAPHVDLPAYPWQRTRLWTEPPAVDRLRHGEPGHRPLLAERVDAGTQVWQADLSTVAVPWLRDHVVDGVALLPGSAFLDAALSAAERPDRGCLALQSVSFRAPLVIDAHDVPVLQVSVEEGTGRFSLRSRRATEGAWTVHATGQIVDGTVEPRPTQPVTQADPQTVTAAELYAWLSEHGPSTLRCNASPPC